jgi:hypothetical protein
VDLAALQRETSLCLLRNLTVFSEELCAGMEQRQEKTRTETSAGTRWIIGAGGGSVKPQSVNSANFLLKRCRRLKLQALRHWLTEQKGRSPSSGPKEACWLPGP